jgi:hypothetical protein
MERLPTKLISTIDATTIRFQTEIINRLKLFDFSKSAILHYCESQKKDFQGYSFDNLQGQFKLVGFKKGRKVKSIEYKEMVTVGNSYIKGELTDSIFVLNMATFEHWLLWVLKTLILEYTAPKRPLIPFQIGHPFRSKSAGYSGTNQATYLRS